MDKKASDLVMPLEARLQLRGSVLIPMFLLLVLLAMLLLVTPVHANGNGFLAQSKRFYLTGNVTAVGVGLRGVGEGDIFVEDIPLGADVYQAYLYWATIGSANTFTSPVLNGVSVNGELIGTSGNTCWQNAQNNFVYRADVTDLITGNGTYTISGLPDSLGNGNDSQGASLVVVYADPSMLYHTIIVNDGAVTLDFVNNTYADTIEGFSTDIPLSEAQVIYLIGDGQSTWGDGNVNFEGVSIGNDVFSGTDGPYWGTHIFDITDLSPVSPATTTIDNVDMGNPNSPDCLLWAATVFSTSSPPPQDTENELSQSLVHSFYGDVTTAGIGLRGTGEGVITVTGLPLKAFLYRAYLYWATLGWSNTYVSPSLNGLPVDGELIGISADTCWGAQNNFVYRADVTDLVDGNGSYTISGLPDSLSSGDDSQGASLVMLYMTSHGDPYRTIVINDGAVTLDFNVHTYMDVIQDFSISDPLIEARVTYIVGDGQSTWDSGNVRFNGVSIASNVFNGVDGDYWGNLSFEVTDLADQVPSTTTLNNNNPDDPESPDCLLWAATVFSVTPPQPSFAYAVNLPLIQR